MVDKKDSTYTRDNIRDSTEPVHRADVAHQWNNRSITSAQREIQKAVSVFQGEMPEASIAISPTETAYPQKLLTFLQDPHTVYLRGNRELFQCPSVGIVGSRRATVYGKSVARTLGRMAAERGVCVVSGFARGIDTAAMEGALDAGGRSIGVLGGGTDVIYPKENHALYRRMSEKDLFISEYADGTPCLRYHFPVRNRIISALADVIIIVEARLRSGALITAEAAAEQGKEVFAVPGDITRMESAGSNHLLRDGARALVVLEDVFLSIGVNSIQQGIKKKEDLSKEERTILRVLKERGETDFQHLSALIHLSVPELLGFITVLEMKGYIEQEMGHIFIRPFEN